VELSFPTIYCGQPRQTPVNFSYAVTINSEIRRYDRRAARADHLLYAYKMHQIFRYRVNKFENFNRTGRVLMLTGRAKCNYSFGPLEPDVVNNLITTDNGYRIVRNIRFSPAYWEGEKRNLCYMFKKFVFFKFAEKFVGPVCHWVV
jgi:hypothetical protein